MEKNESDISVIKIIIVQQFGFRNDESVITCKPIPLAPDPIKVQS